MKVGSLVKNPSSLYGCPFGVVVEIDPHMVRVYWIKSDTITSCNIYSICGEVICE